MMEGYHMEENYRERLREGRLLLLFFICIFAIERTGVLRYVEMALSI